MFFSTKRYWPQLQSYIETLIIDLKTLIEWKTIKFQYGSSIFAIGDSYCDIAIGDSLIYLFWFYIQGVFWILFIILQLWENEVKVHDHFSGIGSGTLLCVCFLFGSGMRGFNHDL